ncbi:hypothetical protein [Pseudomonas sp. LAIL14HWK12:I7]|jgi:hypothetical protein|uniref:hypothetical protein n=1 Tax=Pseudomonas sp. LAIL14HWK12:I7 TaxID=1259801 RepID=UPI000483BA87|nr:hypothetical protein [Pseudomonas sp. LAIL14HWK12:I7]
MLTHRQRSFIATVEAVNGSFNFLDELLGRPAEIGGTSTSSPQKPTMAGIAHAGWAGRFFRHTVITTRGNRGSREPIYVQNPTPVVKPVEPSKRDESNYLGYVAEAVDVAPLHLYFRSVEKGYRLFVRSSVRYARALYIHKENCVCALPSPFDNTYPTLFELLDCDNIPITFASLEDQAIVRLAPAGRQTPLMLRTFKGVPYTYVCTQGQSPLELRLNILERNAAYLNDPDEV